MLERKGNFLIERYKELTFVGVVGNCPTSLYEAVRIYGKRGKFEVDFGEPEPLPDQESVERYFLAGNVFEPELVHLTVVRHEHMGTSLVNWGYGDTVLDFTEDFASVTGLEVMPPDKEFEQVMDEDITPIKLVYEAWHMAVPKKAAKKLFTETMRQCKEYRPGPPDMSFLKNFKLSP